MYTSQKQSDFLQCSVFLTSIREMTSDNIISIFCFNGVLPNNTKTLGPFMHN